MPDELKMGLGIVATIVIVLLLAFGCGPAWEQAARNDCARQNGQYIYFNGEGHCYPQYTIPGTAPAYGR